MSSKNENTTLPEVNFLADQLNEYQAFGSSISVSLSNDLVRLLSDQLYQSPLKAIEELVVNSYDADAKKCIIFVPPSSDTINNFIAIFDDGHGMDYAGLVNLWQIGRSRKREIELKKKLKRKQIGKFGIGKLAARTIAYKLTYISKTKDNILTVTIDFRDFQDTPDGKITPVITNVREIDDWATFSASKRFRQIVEQSKIPDKYLKSTGSNTWTIAILEDMTEKARQIKIATLQWVLSTAMPLRADFELILNGVKVISSKEAYKKSVKFNLKDFPNERLNALQTATGEKWIVSGSAIKSKSFPNGIKGNVIVTEESLAGGKSDDLIRSHGFFIRVRGRLINDSDPLFGLKPLFFGTYYRLHADIEADDLDEDLKASRETTEETPMKNNFRMFLREIFNYANTLRDNKIAEDEGKNPKKEGDRNQVSARLVELPVADILTENSHALIGAEADQSWFYLTIDPTTNLDNLLKSLYKQKRKKYKYEYTSKGKSERLVKFDPEKATFWINKDHEFALEYLQADNSQYLIQDFVTAEALLEIYLRENQVPVTTVGRILQQRDDLLRSLVRDHSYSFESIATRLRDSGADEYELEISMVVAARALGFTASHIGGSTNPDGIAVFSNDSTEETKIILEAKSSKQVPSLGAIDFAGLAEHVNNENAHGCLLVAPSYPGNTKLDSAAARRAKMLKISCWTIEQLARFVEAAEKRELNAEDLIKVVKTAFTPEEVTKEVDNILKIEKWDHPSLYRAIIRVLEKLEGKLKMTPRNLAMISGLVAQEDGFENIEQDEIRDALTNMAGVSRGGMQYRNKNVVLLVSLAELQRRVSSLTKVSGKPRRISSFHQDE